MTESEAIKVLNMIETHGPLPAMAKVMSINALKKRIARKPTKDKYVLELDFCPECGTEVTYCNYCPLCGQKINWNE